MNGNIHIEGVSSCNVEFYVIRGEQKWAVCDDDSERLTILNDNLNVDFMLVDGKAKIIHVYPQNNGQYLRHDPPRYLFINYRL